MVHCLPGIIAFLGHNPLPEADDLIGKLKRLRGTLGLTQKKLAQKLGIDESTVAGWARGENTPVGPYRTLVEDFVAGNGSRAVAALARHIGVNVNTLWRWERGGGNRMVYIGN